MNKNIMRLIGLTMVVALALLACSRHKIKPTLSAEERLQKAEKMFEKGDYLDAKTEFKIILLNFPASNLSDRAQFFYAECHFMLKEYILAIEEYKKLIRAYPNSDYVDDAQYKVAISSFKLSPKSSLDQTYTEKALEEFQRFLEDYPTSPLVPEATKAMLKCRERLAEKNFKIGESYRKRALFGSAIIYYDYVLDNYYDTSFAEKALWEKAGCYRAAGDRAQADKFYRLYLEKYPKSSKADRIKNRLAGDIIGENK